MGCSPKLQGLHTHPECVSCVCEVRDMAYTYDSDFATELVFDLTSLDGTRRVLLNELEKVLNTHFGCIAVSITRAVCEYVLSLRAEKCGHRQQLEAGEGSDDRTDDVTSKTRAGITRSHGSCPSRPKCTPHSTMRFECSFASMDHRRSQGGCFTHAWYV